MKEAVQAAGERAAVAEEEAAAVDWQEEVEAAEAHTPARRAEEAEMATTDQAKSAAVVLAKADKEAAARAAVETAEVVMAVPALEGWMAVEAAEEAQLLVWRVEAKATVATEAEPRAEAPSEAAGWAAAVEAEGATAAAAPVAVVRGG